jgi:nucleoside-diphosphate-sugar epimerase
MAVAMVTGGSGYLGRNLIRALVARGDRVTAIARSDKSKSIVEALGATSAPGDLDDTAALTAACKGADVVYHAAAQVDTKGSKDDFYRVTVAGTEHVLAAAKAAGVPRFVHVGTEAVIADGKPIVDADETVPYPKNPAGLYPWSKGLAEQRVVAASTDGFATVVIRPRFIWGRDDTSLVPKMAEVVAAGRFAWIAGGRYPTSTCHVANVVEGALLAAEKGAPGGIYFLTDGPTVELRSFLTEMLATQGIDLGTKTVPRWLARVGAAITGNWKKPMITKTELGLFGVQVTVNDAKARKELGYKGVVTHAQGLAEMKAAGPIKAA